MSEITPFRALRPAADLAPRVSSVPYDVVSTDEARALADGEPLSFLRVTRSELELDPAADPYAAEVYDRARGNLERLKADDALVTDPDPTLYVYRLTMGDHVQTGVAGGFSIDEYEQNRIKKHEATRRVKEDDRTRHVVTLRAQTGIVFLTYRASAAVDAAVAAVTAHAPLYDFVAADGVAHQVWKAPAAERDLLAAAFAAVPDLYIADGHHRAASAWRARAELRAGRAPHPPAAGAGDLDTFLAVAFPDDQVRILPYHRVVKDLGDRRGEDLVADLESRFRFVDGPPQPERPGCVGLYVGGRWRTFVLDEAPAGAAAAERLDCERLSRQVLAPLLGIEDLRTDARIDFVGGIRGTAELERWVDSGRAAAAFAMFPVAVADLFAVSDAGESMPPKSTWFEPKLRDGLLIQEI
ncbi:MAG: DUF1015 family protein [Thermoanaerobaculia bacterium]|nr:DUF1015 family protein [Thermoanaerobaculia bacterium]